MCALNFEVVDLMLILAELPEINNMRKTNSQFWDKHDIKSFEHTTSFNISTA